MGILEALYRRSRQRGKEGEVGGRREKGRGEKEGEEKSVWKPR